MIWLRPLLMLMACCFTMTAVSQATYLVDVYPMGQVDDWDLVEFSFRGELEYLSHEVSATQIVVRFRSVGTRERDWDYKEIDLSDTFASISNVRFEGNAITGYQLTVSADEPVDFEVARQFDTRRFGLRVFDPRSVAPVAAAVPEVEAEAAEVTPAEAIMAAETAEPAAPVAVRPRTATPIVGVLEPAPSEVAPVEVASVEVVASASSDDPELLPAATPAAIAAPKPAETLPAPVGGGGGKALLESAQTAATAGEYRQAIALYTKALEVEDPAIRKQALESLGVAREYNGQDAHAKLAYEQFLGQYPDAPEVPRVQQRLHGLITRDLPVQRKLQPGSGRVAAWSIAGNFSQFHQRHTLQVDDGDEVIGVDGLYSDLDVVVDRIAANWSVGARFSGSHVFDFTEDGDDHLFTSSAFLEVGVGHFESRLGRQSINSAGVLGRFDGLSVGYRARSWLDLRAVTGYSVTTSADGFNDDRPFAGASFELSTDDGMFQWAPYFIEQEYDGETDRRAVGMETRYYRDFGSVISLVDYDVYHQKLNDFLVQTNLRLFDGYRFDGTYNRRRAPYVRTQNALIGQSIGDFQTLEDLIDESLDDLAADRTATVDLVSLGVDKELGQRFNVGGTFALTDYSGTDESGNVLALPARTDYYYTAHFRGEDMLGRGTFTTVQLRYIDGETSATTSAFLSNRFGFGGWRLYPRIRVDHRRFVASDHEQWIAVPSFRLELRRWRSASFEFETGYEWSSRETNFGDFETAGYYTRLGYRSVF